MKSSLSSTLKALAAGSLLLGVAAVHAQSTAAPDTSARIDTGPQVQGSLASRPHHGHGNWGAHRMHSGPALFIPGVGALGNDVVQSLALTDKQQALVTQARDEQKALHQARRQAMMHERSARHAQLASGTIDPHQALKAMAEQRQQLHAGQEKLQQTWLAVWDSLSDGQRDKVSVALQDRAERRARHMLERAHKMQEHAERLLKQAQPQSS
jgi:hypothetical protein